MSDSVCEKRARVLLFGAEPASPRLPFIFTPARLLLTLGLQQNGPLYPLRLEILCLFMLLTTALKNHQPAMYQEFLTHMAAPQHALHFQNALRTMHGALDQQMTLMMDTERYNAFSGRLHEVWRALMPPQQPRRSGSSS